MNITLPYENEVSGKDFNGFVKICRIHKETGKSEVLVEKDNLIVYTGSDLLAQCLGGETNSHISHMYVGFNNTAEFTPPAIVKTGLAEDFMLFESPFGVLRLPLSFAPSYFNETNYQNNIVLFPIVIASATSIQGAAFTSGSSYIYEVALIAAKDPLDTTKDVMFSRVNFTPIQYDEAYSLTVVWGVKFTS